MINCFQIEEKTADGWKVTEKMPKNHIFLSPHSAKKWAEENNIEKWRLLTTRVTMGIYEMLINKNNLKVVTFKCF